MKLPVIADAPTSPTYQRVAVHESGPVPPWPHQPLIEWQVLGHCNYDCSYCIQAKKHRVGVPTTARVQASLAFLSSLPGVWEIKTTGGEPFATKLFLDVVVPGVMATQHRLSTLTNLSAPPAVLQRFAALTHQRLAVVSASLHLESTSVESFLERLRCLRSSVHDSTRIVVNSVLVPGALEAARQAQRQVVNAGFVFFPQLMKQKGSVVRYSDAQWDVVRSIVGDVDQAHTQRTANFSPSYEGRACYAGARYAVLDKDGHAFSCRTAKRFAEGYLGHVDTGVQLHAGPRICPYNICPCTTVANRGMIEGVPIKAARFVSDD
jgi:organic radical activating enzyme